MYHRMAKAKLPPAECIKTVCMFLSRTRSCCAEPDVVKAGERTQVISDFKYLDVLIDSNLTFKSHIKGVCNCIKFNLANFRYICSCISTKAALMSMHLMTFSHITCCLTTWSQVCNTSLKPLHSRQRLCELYGLYVCCFLKVSLQSCAMSSKLFHQFQVKKEDQDYLQFLWWKDDTLENAPWTYKNLLVWSSLVLQQQEVKVSSVKMPYTWFKEILCQWWSDKRPKWERSHPTCHEVERSLWYRS